MKTKLQMLRTLLASAVLTTILGGCAGGSMSVFTIPSDYKLQTADIGLGPGTFQAADIRDFPRDTNKILIVVQLSYDADSALCCYGDQNEKLPFVGTLVDVNAGARTALIARELQIMGRVAYVFSAPQDIKTICVGSFGKRDMSQASPVLPAIRAEELKIKKIVRERN